MELQKLLADANPLAMETLRQTKNLLADEDQTELEKIGEYIDKYEFKNAMDVLNKYIASKM